MHRYCKYIFCHAGTYSSDLHKMIYLQNRQFLPADSTLRKQSDGFPTNMEDNKPPPAKKKFSELKKKHRAHDNEVLR